MHLGGFCSTSDFNFNSPGTIIIGGVEVEAYVVIDLENGVYTVGGASKTLAQVLTEDAVNYNSYNPADVNSVPGGGYSASGEGPVVTGDALTYLLAGKTFIFDFTVGDGGYIQISMFKDDYTFDSEWYLGAGVGQRATFVGFPTPTISWPSGVDTPLSIGHHKAAVTHVDGHMAWSIDGGTVQEDDTTAWSPAPNIFGFYLEPGATNPIVHGLFVYPVQANAELPGLSTL